MSLAPRVIFIAAFAAWLPAALSAEWQVSPGSRYREAQGPVVGRTGFTLLSAQETGIQFTNLLGEERSLTNQIYHNGSGVALGDVDGDGLCDIYFGNIDGANVLYRNLGNWKFQDATVQARVACTELDTTGVIFGDIDGDGDLDLLVNSIGHGTSVFTNDGRGRFTESSAGTAARTGSVRRNTCAFRNR